MWKLIKMDFYRLFSSKTIKVGAFIACLMSVGYVLFSLGIIALVKYALNVDPSVADDMGLFISQVSWMSGVDLAEIVFGGSAVLSLFIGCIISANFIGSEQSCGYTKNFAGQLTNKGYMAISKFVVTSFGHIMVLAIYAIVGAISAKLMLGQYINGYDMKHLFAALGLRLMLHIAVNAIIVFLCTLTKSHSVAMIAGCIFGLGVTKAAYLSLSMILSVMKINFDIANYMPDGINDRIGLYTDGALATRAIVVSAVFIVAFVAINYCVVRNRDVK